MRKIILILAALLVLPSLLLAQQPPETVIPVTGCHSGTTNVVTQAKVGVGGRFLEAISLDLPAIGTFTGTVVVATSRETLLSLTVGTNTADSVYTVRKQIQSTAGAAQSFWDKFFLLGETVTATVTAQSAATNNVSISLLTSGGM